MLFNTTLHTWKFTSARSRGDRVRRWVGKPSRFQYQPALEACEGRTLLSAVSWVGGSGDWDTASNWSTGAVPGPGDDVTINVISPITITHSLGNYDAVHSLTISNANDTLSISSGTLSLAAASTLSGPLNLTGGTLTGTGAITVSGLFTWSNATLSGTAAFNANGGMAINGTSVSEVLDARTLNNAGAATWSGSNNIYLQNRAIFKNLAGASFTIQTDQSIFNNGGATPLVSNAGSITKNTTTGTTTIQVPLNNTGSGTITVSTGTLNLTGGGVSSSTSGSALSVASGATLGFGGGTYKTSAASGGVSGAGAVNIFGGQADFVGPYTVTGTTNISGGTANFVTSATLPTLNLTGGTLTGTGNLTVSGAMSWSGNSNLYGAGNLTLPSGSTLNITGASGNEVMDARTLNIAGTATWSGSNNLYMQDGATLNVQSGATFTAQTSQTIFNSGGATPVINIMGTFNESPVSGSTTIQPVFNLKSGGILNVNAGTLVLDGGGLDKGSMTMATGTTLDFNAGVYTVASPTTITGTGTAEITGGAVYAYTNLSIATLNLIGGTLGGTAIVTVTGTMTWSNSTMNGTGSTVLPSGATLNINGAGGNETLDTRTLTNSGTINWSGANNIYMQNGAILNNKGTFNILNGETIYNNGGTTPVINNSKTLIENPTTGTTTIQTSFNNTGTVNVQSGTLVLSGGGNDTKTYSVSSGATLEFDGGNRGLSSTSSISGAGSVVFAAGYTDDAGKFTATGPMTVSGGTADFEGTVSLGTLNLTGGYLGGIGALTVTSAFNWSGNSTLGGGYGSTFTVASTATMSIIGTSVNEVLDYRNLINKSASATWSGSNNLYFQDGAVFINSSGATFTIQTDETIYNNGGATPSISNAGTITKNTTSGITTIEVPFTNTGAVNVSSGTVTLTAGGSDTETLAAASGATLNFDGGAFTITGSSASLGGAGTIEISGGTVSIGSTLSLPTLNLVGGMLTGSGDLTVTTAMTWTNSTMSGSGSTTVASSATLTINGTNVNEILDTRTFNLAGTASWSGTNNIYMQNGAVLDVASGSTFTIQTNQNIYNHGGATPDVIVAGTITKNTTTGITTIQPLFDDNGTLNVATGTVTVTGGGNGSGSIALSSGTTLNFSGGVMTVGSVSGMGAMNFTAGTGIITGTFTAPAGVSVSSSATAVFEGGGSSGTFTNAGIVVIYQGTTFALSGNYAQTGGETDLNNATITVPSGGSVTISGGNFDGSGTVSAPSNGFTFNNSGGTLYVGGNGFIGTLTIDGNYTQGSSGTLVLDVGGSGAGQFDVLNVAGTATLAGTLDVFGVGGYTPPVGTELVVLTYGSHSGTFGSVIVNINGHGATVSYASTKLTLTTT
jgi:hypothetical protein